MNTNQLIEAAARQVFADLEEIALAALAAGVAPSQVQLEGPKFNPETGRIDAALHLQPEPPRFTR